MKKFKITDMDGVRKKLSSISFTEQTICKIRKKSLIYYIKY